MLNDDKRIQQYLLLPPKHLINVKIYLFLYSLIKKIFLKDKKIGDNYFQFFLNKINSEIIKVKSKYINTEYTSKNLKNIFNFIKSQNRIFADDILEGILIFIFSSVYKKEEINPPFEELIFMDKNGNNVIFSSGNYQIIDFFDSNKLFPEELSNLKKLLETEDKYEDKKNNNSFKILKKSPLYNLLNEIENFKLDFQKEKNKNKNIDKYIHMHNLENKKDYDELFLLKYKNKKLIRLFLISVYIYCQYMNKTSLSFDYNLSRAYLTNIFSNAIFSPLKIIPNISQISLSRNHLGYNALFNLSRTLIFNKNIEKYDLNCADINFYDLEYFNLGLGVYDNYSLKELNICYNLIKKDAELYLSNLLSHLKGLKIINLSNNHLKRGLASFFIMLKELYCHNQTNLETLILVKCKLDNPSFYELGELLKSPFCKLKKLYLNRNTIPDSDNFFRKLKKNKSLEELYLNKTHINDNDIDNIIKLINNTHIRVLYLNENKKI